MTLNYLTAISELEANPELTITEITLQHNSHIKWGGDLKKKLERKIKTEFRESLHPKGYTSSIHCYQLLR